MVTPTTMRRLIRLAVAVLSALALWPATPVLAQPGVPRFDKVYTFPASDPARGNRPRGGLLQATHGNLYSTTETCPSGSAGACHGSIFRATLRVVTQLHVFQADGGSRRRRFCRRPTATLARPRAAAASPAVFRMLPDGTVTVSTAPGMADGAAPRRR